MYKCSMVVKFFNLVVFLGIFTYAVHIYAKGGWNFENANNNFPFDRRKLSFDHQSLGQLQQNDPGFEVNKTNHQDRQETVEGTPLHQISQQKRHSSEEEYRNILANDTCKPVHIRISEKPLPVTGLASFPGSGNTWTRHLLQQVSGIGTASVYCDKKLRKGGFEFECEKQLDRVLAVKTHSASLEKFERVIMIIRNPYEAMLAFFHFMYSGYHTGQTKDKNFFNGVWDKHVFKQTRQWKKFHIRYLRNFTRPLYPLFYDRLQHDLYNELQRVFDFLDYKINKTAIACTVKNQEGHFHREKKPVRDTDGHALTVKDLYTDEMIRNITEAVSEVQQILETRFGTEWTVSLPDF